MALENLELEGVDGPPAMPFIGARGNFLRFMRDPVGTMVRLNRSYGNIVAMTSGRPQSGIFLFGPEYNRQVLGNGSKFHSTGHVHAGPVNSANHRISRGLLSMNGEQHKEQRKIMAPSFHPGLFPAYHEKIVRLVNHMLDRWEDLSVVDFAHEMRQVSLAISGTVLFGFDSPAQAYEIGDIIERWMKGNFSIARAIRVTFPSSPYRRMLLSAEKVESILRRTIRQRKLDLQAGSSDVLSLLVQTENNGHEALTEEQQVAHLTLLFGASYDTVANALGWTMLLLCQHPAVCARLVDELEGLQGNAPEPVSSAQFPLLDMVIKESLRILPPIVFSSRVSSEPVDIGPHRFAKGTTFILSYYVTHHLSDLFPRPEKFLPERWVNGNPSPYAYLPFGAGAHVCLGASFALMTMKIVIAMIVQRYRLAIVPNSRIDRKVVLTLIPEHGLPMRVQSQDRKFGESKAVLRGNIHEMVDLT